MATVEDLLRTARSQLGYVESGGKDGRSGNLTKYWVELDPSLNGQPWCAAFQRWVEKHSAGPLLPVEHWYYCPSLVTYAKQHGLWLTPAEVQPGDLYFCDFTGNGVAEHVGLMEKPWRQGYLTGIEGNTSSGVAGSQANGGGVYRRERPEKVLLGGLAYHRLLAVTPPRKPARTNPYASAAAQCERGATGEKVKYVQWAVGVPVDGSFGPQTQHAVQEFQRHHNLVPDGVVGPRTLAVLRTVTH